MPILGIIDSAKTGNLSGNSFDSIATTTIGASPTASVTFSSIPSTYKHLQVRFISRNTRGSSTLDGIGIRMNADSANNYANHRMYGAGAGQVVGTGETSVSRISIGIMPASTGGSANVFGGAIVDILDYKDTNKNKTVRSLAGYDDNGEAYGVIGVFAGVWLSTTAITSLTIISTDGTGLGQYSSFALYGIKG
jgi:hypothetical protein